MAIKISNDIKIMHGQYNIMTGTEVEALDILLKNKGMMHYYKIAAVLRISSHYAYLICKLLERKGITDFDTLEGGGICRLTEKGKTMITGNWVI